MSKKLLIAVAINEEFKAIKKLMTEKKMPKGVKHPMCSGFLEGFPVDVVMTSMGMEVSSQVASDVCDGEKYAGVLILGYCGGLSLTLQVGDAVIPCKVISALDKFEFDMDLALIEDMGKAMIQEGMKYRATTLTTQPMVLETPADKEKLFKESGAEAVDMETSEIIRVGRKRGLKTAAMKVVIDDVGQELPHFNDYIKKAGKIDHLNVAQVLIRQPGLSYQLSQNMKRGAEIIKGSVPGLVKAVCKHWKIKSV
jgi:nucleoside phosphorylase